MRIPRSFLPLLTVLCAGCAAAVKPAPVCGTWLEPIPGMEPRMQGFTLHEDGRAESVNMATLQVESWKREGEDLVLRGKSIGNGQTIAFERRCRIESLDEEALVCREEQLLHRYRRAQR